MSREWQQKKLPEYVMPNAVYYQSLWAVRDLERMEMRLKELKRGDFVGGVMAVKEPSKNYGTNSCKVQQRAMEAAVIEERVDAINRALMEVPEIYRQCIMDSVLQKETEEIHPGKLWKIWKQKFLYGVARNLYLM